VNTAEHLMADLTDAEIEELERLNNAVADAIKRAFEAANKASSPLARALSFLSPKFARTGRGRINSRLRA